MSATRVENDSMGGIEVPADALYGASTRRAVFNFPIGDRPVSPALIHALGLVKWAAARANRELGAIEGVVADLIERAAEEVWMGKLDAHFVVDVFQTGSGTSTNMNANEVIANRCSQLAGNPLGSKNPAHPNDHVNRSQSSNDTFPTAIHIAASLALRNDLLPALSSLQQSLALKATAFQDVLKTGRTHLMDATPVRLGQEFSGYAHQIEKAVGRAWRALEALLELPLGGTAVGTGLNRHAEFPSRAIGWMAEKTGIDFREASDHFEAQGARDGVVEASGLLKTIAVSLFKIANDIRFLSSGPRCGIGEIRLPATQPGSSIMPGKVNPVLCESVMQVAAQVVGNDATVTWCGANGNLELNVMMPVMARNVLESAALLANVSNVFRERCVDGIEPDTERCAQLIERSMSMATGLAPIVGYDKAAMIAKEALQTGKSVRQICLDRGILPPGDLENALDPARMTRAED